VLNLNDILRADAVVDQDSLPKLKMPNRDGFTTKHGFMTRDGKPDTNNTACMKDCVREVRLSSEMPDYARDQHGNLAEQVRGGGTKPGAGAARSGLDVAKAAACTACHGVSDFARSPAGTRATRAPLRVSPPRSKAAGAAPGARSRCRRRVT
jgi:cytochrome c